MNQLIGSVEASNDHFLLLPLPISHSDLHGHLFSYEYLCSNRSVNELFLLCLYSNISTCVKLRVLYLHIYKLNYIEIVSVAICI